MSTSTSQYSSDVIEAAGGLVWRNSKHGREIAIIHRERDNAWTLPKGKRISPTESWQNTALREVSEELGCSQQNIQIGEFAGCISYITHQKPKVVLFWHMTLTGEVNLEKSNEADKIQWLSIQDAIDHLNYPRERQLLSNLGSISLKTRLSSHLLKRLHWHSPAYRRLGNAIPAYRAELYLLNSEHHKPSYTLWFDVCTVLLDQAEQALEHNNAELGWRCFNAAQRVELFAHPPEDLQVKATTILYEAKRIKSSWRQQAINDLLSNLDKSSPNIYQVFTANFLLQEYFDNTYHKLYTIKNQLILLGCITLGCMSLWLWKIPQMINVLPINNPNFVAGVSLSGVIGAAISSILSLSSGSATESKIPDQLLNSWITLIRLVVGGTSAIIVYAALASGLLSGFLQIGEKASWSLLVAAFVAGWSERLVGRVVETVTK